MITISDLIALGIKIPSRPRLTTGRIGYLAAIGTQEFSFGMPLPEKRAILVNRLGCTVRMVNGGDQMINLGLFGPQDTSGKGEFDAIWPGRNFTNAVGSTEIHSVCYDGGIFIGETGVNHTFIARGTMSAASLGNVAGDMYIEYFDLGAGGSLELLQNDGLT